MSDKFYKEEKMMKQTLFRQTWILKVVAILITYHLSLTATEAQTFTQRIQQQTAGGGRVVLHQDAAIDELVNGRPVATPQPRQTTGQNTGQANRQQQQQRNNEEHSDARDQQQRNDNRQPIANETQEASTDSVAQTPQRTRKVMGYRIQVYAGGKTRADRQRAEQTANTIKTLFPGHKVYVHFYSPRWICRMGNFRTLAEAKEVLNEVVRMGYDTATLVRGRITVPY